MNKSYHPRTDSISRHISTWLLISSALLWMAAPPAMAQSKGGRDLEGRQTFSIGLSLGSVFDLDGKVEETTRPIEQIGGRTSGAPPEAYSWKELGFKDNFSTKGFFLEKMWRYVTLHSHFQAGSPTVSSVADRNYYIGVGDVAYGGRDYEYLLIPEGTEYKGSIDLYSLDLRMLITPVSFGAANAVSFTPWIHLGLMGFLADYEIEAGIPSGVTQYENPPRDYVIGGKGSGRTGLVVPEFGLGAELRVPITEKFRLTLQAHGALFRYNGSNSALGVSSRNEKALDVDYRTIGARALGEWSTSERLAIIFGAEYQYWTGEVEVRAKDKPEEEMLALREKFDKDAQFKMTSVSAFIGLRF